MDHSFRSTENAHAMIKNPTPVITGGHRIFAAEVNPRYMISKAKTESRTAARRKFCFLFIRRGLFFILANTTH